MHVAAEARNAAEQLARQQADPHRNRSRTMKRAALNCNDSWIHRLFHRQPDSFATLAEAQDAACNVLDAHIGHQGVESNRAALECALRVCSSVHCEGVLCECALRVSSENVL